MNVVLVVVGVVLVGAALIDLAWTTVAAGSGAGPLTGRLAAGLWRTALSIHGRWPSHTFLSVAGVGVVLAVLGAWIAMVLTGWSVMFNAADGAVRNSDTGAPAAVVARLYFVGYTVFTLGNGDYQPGSGLWQLATVLATGTGLILVTLAITYLVPVASAVTMRRQLSSFIASLGSSPQEIVATGWDGTGFGGLSQYLVALTPLIETSRQQHLTYPVLHYFHSHDAQSAAAPNVTNLAQAMLLLQAGVAPEVRPPAPAVEPLVRSLDAFLGTLRSAHLDPAEPLPPPSLEPLRQIGIPTVTDDDYARVGDNSRERRALLAGFLADDGWPVHNDTQEKSDLQPAKRPV